LAHPAHDGRAQHQGQHAGGVDPQHIGGQKLYEFFFAMRVSAGTQHGQARTRHIQQADQRFALGGPTPGDAGNE